uniref:Uncharacterized protein LOC100175116 n=1 Tax=Phallusia mammillata TaxID=59560 RepID=A0A6F9DFN1_9ASCI|nr:uncharacterized protein LOC100175116 [Phallusia mammillata]
MHSTKSTAFARSACISSNEADSDLLSAEFPLVSVASEHSPGNNESLCRYLGWPFAYDLLCCMVALGLSSREYCGSLPYALSTLRSREPFTDGSGLYRLSDVWVERGNVVCCIMCSSGVRARSENRLCMTLW